MGGSQRAVFANPTSGRRFTLVLAGGGARGYAHVGVLKGLEDEGMMPSALVGVSMGAVVASTYSLREDWYEALMNIDTSGFPQPHYGEVDQKTPFMRQAVGYAHTAWNMVLGWGAPPSVVEAGRTVLSGLLGGAALDEGRVPVAVCATDLRTGERVTMDSGAAADVVYASAALAGVLPPLAFGDYLLADGAYADIAPIDVARSMGPPLVIAVDPGQTAEAQQIHNGVQCVMRAMEICHRRHADLRVHEADVVLRPEFDHPIDVLDFGARQECVDLGVTAVRNHRKELHMLFEAGRE